MNAFKLIKFLNPDTHLLNIMIVLNDDNIIDKPELFTPEKIKYKSYTYYQDGEPKTFYLEDLGVNLHIYDFDKASLQKANNTTEFIPQHKVDFFELFEREFKNIQYILQDKLRNENPNNNESYLKIEDSKIYTKPIAEIEFPYLCSEIYNMISNVNFIIGRSNDIFYNLENYITNMLPFIPYLKCYKDLHMLVRDDMPKIDSSNPETYPPWIQRLVEWKNNKLLDLNKPAPDMDSIKRRTISSYSFELLMPKRNNSNA